MKAHKILSSALFTCLVALPSTGVAANKEDHTVWNLEVRFINGSKTLTDSALQGKAATWVQVAEEVYQRKPRLAIQYSVVKRSTKGGQDLSSMKFDSAASYRKFMEENFDIEAATKTEGYYPVLVTDSFCIGKYSSGPKKGQYKCKGGRATFPHSVEPFGRKHGITLQADVDEYTFAHELGHVFGLKHTFEPYVGLKRQCNKAYTPKGKPNGLCNSCPPGKILYDADGDPEDCDGRSNIMDYCTSAVGDEYLNQCQETRASNQRYAYMTADGETNYYKMKGLAGTAICEEDSDCDDGQYCDKGVAVGVGRNQCKDLKPLGQACTRGGECSSDRCAGLKCAEAHECMADTDCGSGEYCNLGVAGVGRNECKTKLADHKACTKDHQCASGHCSGWRPGDVQTSGICYTPNSKRGGESCEIDLECIAGKCNSKKNCVCRNDSDCSSGYWCDQGLDLHENSCKRKLSKGEVCGTVGEIGVGHRCKSGKCKVSGLSTKLKCQ